MNGCTDQPLHLKAAVQTKDLHAEVRATQSPEEKKERSLYYTLDGLRLKFPNQEGTMTEGGKKIRAVLKKMRRIEEQKSRALQAEKEETSSVKIQSIVRRFFAKTKCQQIIRDESLKIEQGEKEAKGEEERLQKEKAKLEAKEKERVEAEETAAAAQAEQKAAKKARRKAREQEKKAAKAAKKADFEALSPEQRLMHIVSSYQFRKSCLDSINQSKEFSEEQKAFMLLIYNSRLPLYHDDIVHFSTQFYKIFEACKGTCSNKQFKEIMSTGEPLDEVGCKAVYDFIREHALSFLDRGHNIEKETQCLSLLELRRITISCIKVMSYCRNLPKKKEKKMYIGLNSARGKDQLIQWAIICNQNVTSYLDQLGTTDHIFTEEEHINVEVLRKINATIEFKGHNAFKKLIQCISLRFLSADTAEAKEIIYGKDLIKNEGIISKILDEVIIPRLIEIGDVVQLKKEIDEVFYQKAPDSKFGKDIKGILDTHTPYHQELLSLVWPKDDPHFLLMSRTIAEAYQSGIISNWTRIIYIRALISRFAKMPKAFEPIKDTKTGRHTKKCLEIAFYEELPNIKKEDFSEILDEDGIEVLPPQESALAYGRCAKAISTFYKEAYRDNVFLANTAADYLIKNIARLVNLTARMRETNQ
ncbi:MAG: hypothetical protein SP4CHLAM5_00510 [Chlamydiia bacterium]|nr:hypothetical protein [Chlamydiia bacterium]MCH9617928.1 hypothetical protein [Chlamydiia bacterium]MCH9624144.1 hypothetical protein [Chlamydiia bacterium]